MKAHFLALIAALDDSLCLLRVAWMAADLANQGAWLCRIDQGLEHRFNLMNQRDTATD